MTTTDAAKRAAAWTGEYRPAAGIGMMLLGVLLFSLNDALAKWLVTIYAVGQVVLLRCLAALLLLAPFVLRTGGLPAVRVVPQPRLQVLRVALGTTEAACFFWAVGHMPLADAITYWMAAPIFVTVMSALLLRERVGLRRWAVVLMGFAGVMVALGPALSGAAPLPALVALAGSMLYAGFIVATRQLRGTPDVLLVGFQMLGGVALGAMLLPLGWTTPSPRDLLLLLGLGVLATLAHVCVTRSLKLAPATVVVPYQYSFVLWAAVLGWAFFGDVPQPHIWLGGAIVVVAGLVLFRLEARGAAARHGRQGPSPGRPEAAVPGLRPGSPGGQAEG